MRFVIIILLYFSTLSFACKCDKEEGEKLPLDFDVQVLVEKQPTLRMHLGDSYDLMQLVYHFELLKIYSGEVLKHHYHQEGKVMINVTTAASEATCDSIPFLDVGKVYHVSGYEANGELKTKQCNGYKYEVLSS